MLRFAHDRVWNVTIFSVVVLCFVGVKVWVLHRKRWEVISVNGVPSGSEFILSTVISFNKFGLDFANCN